MNTNIYASLIQAYKICNRQAWLMSRNLIGDKNNEFLKIGKFISETTYKKNKKEIRIGNNVIDIIKSEKGQITIIEVKKSSRALESSIFQLLFYIYKLNMKNIKAELRIPKEKKVIEVVLTDEKKQELDNLISEIERYLEMEKPKNPQWFKYCKTCSYSEFCWA